MHSAALRERPEPIRFRSLGDVCSDTAFSIANAVTGREQSLDERAGSGLTTLDYGMSQLRERAADLGVPAGGMSDIEAKALAAFRYGCKVCESPIERTILAALITAPWRGFGSLPPKVHLAREEPGLPQGDIIIVPQLAFVKYRFDFGIIAEIGGRREIIAVECDGAAFHNDKIKDGNRDKYLETWGIPTHRLSGTEIHNDPFMAVAFLVMETNARKAHARS
jgi:very-short-patch-repair endonuclease